MSEIVQYVQLGVTVVGMFVAPYVTIRLSLKQFHSQKWWERKADAYTRVLEALSFFHFYYGKLLDAETMHYSWNPSGDITANFKKAGQALCHFATAGAYLISENSTTAIRDLLSVHEKDYQHPFDCYDSTLAAVSKAIPICREDAALEIRSK